MFSWVGGANTGCVGDGIIQFTEVFIDKSRVLGMIVPKTER
jgi:hypothetical protein